MRHENVSPLGKFDELDIAAVWPNGSSMADALALAQAHVRQPAASTPDVPRAAGMLLIASYVALLAALAGATVAPGPSLFAIAICAVFAFMFFAVPATFLKIEPESDHRVSMAQFLRGGMQTFTGHCSGGSALVQMLLVPVALTFGVLCIGVAAAWIM